MEDKPKLKIQKTFNIVSIALKLAQINGYDAEGRIKDENGNIANLLEYSMKEWQIINWRRCIYLLKKANVPIDLIVNENIKDKLKSRNQPIINTYQEPEVFEKTQIYEPPERVVERPKKRKLIEDIPNNSKIPRWEYPD